MEGASENPANDMQMSEGIKFCEHKDELLVYSFTYNTALCNDCYFEKKDSWGQVSTLKQSSNKQISSL